jgi:hypothetical protein
MFDTYNLAAAPDTLGLGVNFFSSKVDRVTKI